MKLSQMSSDKAADVYLQIVPDVKLLLEDEGLKKILNTRKKPKNGKEAEKLGKVAMLETAAYLLKSRRENIWNILAALNDKTLAEISQQNVLQLTMQIIEILNDKELIGFFISLANLGQQQL